MGLCINLVLLPVGTFHLANRLVQDGLVAPELTAASNRKSMAITWLQHPRSPAVFLMSAQHFSAS